MTMMQDFATNVEAILLSMGWKEVVTDIEKMTVRAIFSAPGATEQELVLKAGGYKKTLAEFGGPELYPATVEYESVVDYQEFRAKMVEADPALEQMIQEERELNRAEEIAAQYPQLNQAVLKTVVAECALELAEKEVSVTEKAHLERLETGCMVPDGDEPVNDVPAGNPSNRGLIEQTMHDAAPFVPSDPHLAAAAVRDLEDAVSALGESLSPMSYPDTVAAPEQVPSTPNDEEGIMSRNDLVLMSMKNLNVMAKRLGLKKCSKLNKMALIEAIAGALDLPSTLPVQSEREAVKGQMAEANAEMLDRPAPPIEDGLPDLENFVEVGVLVGAPKIRVGHTAYLVAIDDDRRIAIKGVRFELKRVVNEKELRFSNKTIVPAKWLGWVVRAIFAS